MHVETVRSIREDFNFSMCLSIFKHILSGRQFMQNYYYQPNINDTYLNRLQRLNQIQNQFNNQYPQYNNPLPLNNQIIFVQGETGAKAYQIPNNTTVLLMSSESNEFFIKTTDSSGFPTIRKFTFQEQQNQEQQKQEQQKKQCSCNCQSNNYVTQEEFNNFKKEILNFYESNLSNGKPTISNKKSNDGYNDKKLVKRNDAKTNGNESDEK